MALRALKRLLTVSVPLDADKYSIIADNLKS